MTFEAHHVLESAAQHHWCAKKLKWQDVLRHLVVKDYSNQYNRVKRTLKKVNQ